ncbi:MAG: alanine--tRNA ligase [Thermodesulfobacteria bacterium]|nr:alanine--tRNA ligase [Thermodesulfobacteriota bacterium]
MKGKEVRRIFLEFFKSKGHQVVPSSSLIPADDPTLLFTNAGMVQFKKVFLGEETRPYKRATSCQKCMRAGGKHNDLENVGYTARHHTFFEMLGNFSFGDYFKAEAIEFAWELVTKVFNLPKEKLYVTIFKEDDEAEELWKKIAGLPQSKIIRLGEKDNFWAMGDTGPCGPCSEIIYDQGEKFGCGKPDCAPGCDCDRYLEIWNLVFMQYERDAQGNLKPLPKGCIDTGMGLERITAVLQGVSSNYETDLFAGIMKKISELTGKNFKETLDTEIAFKVIADHIRASVFLIAEGIMPSNEGRGYVLRRIIRRAERFGKLLGLKDPFLYEIVDPVVEEYGDVYPEVIKAKKVVEEVIKVEEEKFLETLSTGLEILEKEVKALKEKGENVIPGELLFKLYDTYGFPYDLVRDYAIPLGFKIDLQGFEKLREEARQKSKKSWKGAIEKTPEVVKKLISEEVKTEFVGYDTLKTKSRVVEVFEENGDLFAVFAETPFYPEGGGQVWDKGKVLGEDLEADVLEVHKIGSVIFHKLKLKKGKIEPNKLVILEVDLRRRLSVMRHHTATHLLHAALRKVLGEHVRQAGSLVDEDRLRFDFTHFKALSKEEIKKVEELVNTWILENYRVETFFTSKKEAERLGVIALFEEKYGEVVRVVRINDVSAELCGGTHVKSTGEIGMFKIVSETSVASGIRRIEAVAGMRALEWTSYLEERIEGIAKLLKTSSKDIEKRIEALFKEIEELKNEIKKIKSVDLREVIEKHIESAEEVNGIKLIVAELPISKMDELRDIGDRFKSRIKSGIIFLLGDKKPGQLAVCMITKDLCKKVSAKEVFSSLFDLGLKGGGKEHLAQGSFKSKVSVENLKKRIKEVVQEKI